MNYAQDVEQELFWHPIKTGNIAENAAGAKYRRKKLNKIIKTESETTDYNNQKFIQEY